jgi:hypothetical protein
MFHLKLAFLVDACCSKNYQLEMQCFGKGVITNNLERCFNHEESTHHIFLHCNVSNTVWQKIFQVDGIEPHHDSSVQ